MVDNRDQAGRSVTHNNYIEGRCPREEDTSLQITALGHSLNVVNVGLSVSAGHFHGNVYEQSGGKKLRV